MHPWIIREINNVDLKQSTVNFNNIYVNDTRTSMNNSAVNKSISDTSISTASFSTVTVSEGMMYSLNILTNSEQMHQSSILVWSVLVYRVHH